MRELEHRQKTRKIIYSTPALVVLAVAVAILGKGAWNAMEKEHESGTRVEKLNEKTASLKTRQAELEEYINFLNTEAGIAEEIRTKFNVAKEGERFVVLVESAENRATTSSSSGPWYEKWWNALKNLR